MSSRKIDIEATGDYKEILKNIIDQEDVIPMVFAFFKGTSLAVTSNFAKDNDRLGHDIHEYLKKVIYQLHKELSEDN